MQTMNDADFKLLRIAIVGARGYSGLELTRVLLRHPSAKIVACLATQAQWQVSQFLANPKAEKIPVYILPPLSEGPHGISAMAKDWDLAFLATPPEVSMKLAPALLSEGCSVIDLSGAFRLPQSLFEKYYAHSHTAPELISRAIYGLAPWNPIPLRGSSPVLVSNPGCYATSVLMAVLPLLRAKLIKPESIVIDSKSGTSGAGRKAAENLLFTEVEGECLPYKIGKHQHLPEIINWTKNFAGASIDPFFTTNLLPVRRGIVSGIYATLELQQTGNPGISGTSGASGSSEPSTDAAEMAIQGAFEAAYGNYPLVKCSRLLSNEKEAAHLLSLKRVVGTAQTQISYVINGQKLYLFSIIDNLMKGAASQAIENFNQWLGLPIGTALSELEGVL